MALLYLLLECRRPEFASAEFGINGLEMALGSLMGLVHSGQIELSMLISKLTVKPARIIGREELGSLKPGNEADITIFDPEAEWAVELENFLSKGKNSPLAGNIMRGKIVTTLFGGKIVYSETPI